MAYIFKREKLENEVFLKIPIENILKSLNN
jgi:hypothetical protein